MCIFHVPEGAVLFSALSLMIRRVTIYLFGKLVGVEAEDFGV
jgi:hypothetical protein